MALCEQTREESYLVFLLKEEKSWGEGGEEGEGNNARRERKKGAISESKHEDIIGVQEYIHCPDVCILDMYYTTMLSNIAQYGHP